jgi:hypothetical protein
LSRKMKNIVEIFKITLILKYGMLNAEVKVKQQPQTTR